MGRGVLHRERRREERCRLRRLAADADREVARGSRTRFSVRSLSAAHDHSASVIIFGIITEQSIGKLFLAGIAPGLLIALFVALTSYLWCAVDPSLGPKGAKSSWRERLASLPELAWMLLVFVVIIGGLMKGFLRPPRPAAWEPSR